MRNLSFDIGLFRFFIFWYICGLVLLTFDLLPVWLEWANAVFLYLTGVIGAFFLVRSYGGKTGGGLTAVIFLLSMFLEGIGVQLNLFFGSYEYASDFGAMILGVPLTIGAAWVAIVSGSHALMLYILGMLPRLRGWGAFVFYVLLGALLVTGIDFVLDPVNYLVQEYWIWNEGGWYYGIPFSNFQGWFIIGFLLHAIMYLVLRFQGRLFEVSAYWQPRTAALYMLLTFMFTLLALLNALWLAGAIGIGIMIFCAAVLMGRRQTAERK